MKGNNKLTERMIIMRIKKKVRKLIGAETTKDKVEDAIKKFRNGTASTLEEAAKKVRD